MGDPFYDLNLWKRRKLLLACKARLLILEHTITFVTVQNAADNVIGDRGRYVYGNKSREIAKLGRTAQVSEFLSYAMHFTFAILCEPQPNG